MRVRIFTPALIGGENAQLQCRWQVQGETGKKTFNERGRKDAREMGARSPTAVTAFAAAAYVFVTRMQLSEHVLRRGWRREVA